MTAAEALAELDRRFEEYMAGEVERMRAERLGEDLIAAIVVENRHRFAEQREAAAAWAADRQAQPGTVH